MRNFFIIIIILISSFECFAKQINGNKSINTSHRCKRFFKKFEKKYRIPSKLLESISIHESGRWHKTMRRKYPWPWAVNHNGRPYYFDTKYDAVKFVNKLIKNGENNIDVGCMQISLRYHKKNFKSLSEAFEPRHNINLAGRLMSENFNRHSTWFKAVARYHSSKKDKGNRYSKRVNNIWRDLLKRTEKIIITAKRNIKARKKFHHRIPRIKPNFQNRV